jgi:V/A-type H+/Na+-transporting ATPase subunit A
MMQVAGEEGIALEDYVTYQKSLLVDMVYLQQDAFDPVDASVPMDRQKASFELVRNSIQRDYPFKDKDEARSFFVRMTGLFKNLNYAPWKSRQYEELIRQIDELLKTLGRAAPAPAAPANETAR